MIKRNEAKYFLQVRLKDEPKLFFLFHLSWFYKKAEFVNKRYVQKYLAVGLYLFEVYKCEIVACLLT